MANHAKRGAQGSIYAYETRAGTRYRFTYRDSAGRQTTKRGFLSRPAARTERERLMGRVHRGEVRVSRESLEGYWLRYLKQRKPDLENGSWQDYRRHGELRILPHLGHRKLTSLTAPELREWLVELVESGEWAPKTLNNALKALVVCLNHAVGDGLIALMRRRLHVDGPIPAGVQRGRQARSDQERPSSASRSVPTARP